MAAHLAYLTQAVVGLVGGLDHLLSRSVGWDGSGRCRQSATMCRLLQRPSGPGGFDIAALRTLLAETPQPGWPL